RRAPRSAAPLADLPRGSPRPGRAPRSGLRPYTTLFRSSRLDLWFSRSADGAPVLPGHERSRVSAGRMEITAEHLPDGAETYLCGSSAFLPGAREQHRLAGVDEERVHFELYSPNDWLLPGS